MPPSGGSPQRAEGISAVDASVALAHLDPVMSLRVATARSTGTEPESNVVPLSVSDEAIVRGLVAEEQWAADALYDRYAGAIERMLRRTLGRERHTDIEDLLHDVFLQAIVSADKLRDSVALLAWLQKIAVHTAYRAMRRRRARSWLRFYEPERLPEVFVDDVSPELREAYSAFYDLLQRIPASEQLVFTLRYVEGMELTRIADACDVSLSTAKRRLAKAEARFSTLASRDPVLAGWIGEGTWWPR